MKLNTSVENIKEYIIIAEHGVGKNITLPILSNILLIASGNTLKIRSTNLNIGIEITLAVKIEKDGVCAVPGSTLVSFINSLQPKDIIEFEIINQNLSLKTKHTNTLIKTIPYEDFPTIPKVTGQSFKIKTNLFVQGIQGVLYATAQSDIKPEMASVYVYQKEDSLVFVATDSFRLAEKKIKVKNIYDFQPLLIPNKNGSEIVKVFGNDEGECEIFYSKNQIGITNEHIYFSSRIIDGVFPDYEQIIPKQPTTETIILKQDLLNALKLATVFTDKFNQITFSVKPNKKEFGLFTKNSERGENTIFLTTTLSGETVEVNLSGRYLLDCLQYLSADSVSLSFSGPQKPISIKGISDQTFQYLIMPMNR